jgi:TP901-1 family phage major tail protein
MADIIGNAIFLEVGATLGTTVVVVGLTSKSITFSAETPEVTDQQSSGGWRQYIGGGYLDGKMSVQGWYDESAIGAQTAFGYIENGSTIKFKFGENGTAKTYFSGSAIVTNLQISGNGSSPSDYTFDLQTTGPVSRASTSF